jgi:hypothetical protein
MSCREIRSASTSTTGAEVRSVLATICPLYGLVVVELRDDVDEHHGHFRGQVGGCAAGAVCDLPGERGHAVGHKRTHAVCVASLDRLMLPGRRAIVGRLRFV